VYAAALEHWGRRSEFGTVLLNLFGTAPPDGWVEQLSDEQDPQDPAREEPMT
jgi:hypothetical protein